MVTGLGSTGLNRGNCGKNRTQLWRFDGKVPTRLGMAGCGVMNVGAISRRHGDECFGHH